MNTAPPIIPVGQEPPPLHSNGDHRHQGHRDTPKGKPGHRRTSDRFAVLNAFVDVGMIGLTKVEALTWMVLYRDTRDGTACTSMESIASRIGCTRRAVVSAVQRLRRRGLLIQVVKGSNLRGASRYHVHPTPNPPRSK